ncbi:MAG: hypothetical protein ABL933_06245 [Methyloglobulus sp.]|nr:hypothetical protein [Methyloglobulus sp.]
MTDTSGNAATVVVTAAEVDVPTEPPAVVAKVTTFAPAVVGKTLTVTGVTTLDASGAGKVQVTTCAAAAQPGEAWKVNPAGNVLFTVVATAVGVTDVLVTVAV